MSWRVVVHGEPTVVDVVVVEAGPQGRPSVFVFQQTAPVDVVGAYHPPCAQFDGVGVESLEEGEGLRAIQVSQWLGGEDATLHSVEYSTERPN